MPNSGYIYRERLVSDSAGVPLADDLARRYPHSTREEWLERCRRGLVLLDGRPADGARPARAGQLLSWHRPAWEEPPAPMWSRVVHEDEDVLAVDKPAGLPTLPGAGFLASSLLYQVRERVPGAAPIHRLGRWTSGIVLFAKNAAARRSLSRQWAERTIGKRYRALASGRPDWTERTIADPIGTVPHARLGSIHAVSADGKPAVSHVVVREIRSLTSAPQPRRSGLQSLRSRDEDLPGHPVPHDPVGDSKEPGAADARGGELPDFVTFLCDVVIATGRPHQIRIHLAAAGHPLVGDPLYGMGGVPIPGSAALPGDPGYTLHAAELRFVHPRTNEPITLACAPPPILRRSDAGE